METETVWFTTGINVGFEGRPGFFFCKLTEIGVEEPGGNDGVG
jgi:hypothetical protein